MTRRETVICAIQHKETDRIPYHFEFTAQEEEKVLQNIDKASFYTQYDGYLHYFSIGGIPQSEMIARAILPMISE